MLAQDPFERLRPLNFEPMAGAGFPPAPAILVGGAPSPPFKISGTNTGFPDLAPQQTINPVNLSLAMRVDTEDRWNLVQHHSAIPLAVRPGMKMLSGAGTVSLGRILPLDGTKQAARQPLEIASDVRNSVAHKLLSETYTRRFLR
jgi:hypothetical protein